MRRIIAYSVLLIIAVAFPAHATAQIVTGRVIGVDDGGRVDLEGATVFWEGTAEGVVAGKDGYFTIAPSRTGVKQLTASYLGYRSLTIDITDYEEWYVEFELTYIQDIEEIVVEKRRSGTTFSRLATQKLETITGAGLMKMACCNLSESFENSATVTVGFTDAVSGAKQVQLLGLSGIYTQMLDENVPTMRGLASTYGWNYTPGPWLETIHISKGASTVVNGYESIAGQINLEFKKPDNSETLFINLYGDESARAEANITSAVRINDKLTTGLFLHGSAERMGHDTNDDGFLDQPRTKLVNVYNRWMWINPDTGVESRTGVKFLYDRREGGQTGEYKAAGDAYVTDITNRGISVFNKTGVKMGHREGQSLGVITSYTNYRQESRFGLKEYEGTQNTFYLNTLFSSFINNTNHRYTTGASFNFDDIDATYSDALPFNNTPPTRVGRREAVGGAYAQYTYDWFDKLTVLAGMRVDYNSRYGWLFTPRANVRYAFTDRIVFRASAGKGYRSPDVITDNIGLMATSRNFVVSGIADLDIERAWNYGANIAFYIPSWQPSTDIVLSLDYFHTDFQNQAVIDMERDTRHVYFYNLEGKSYADAWQADLSVPLARGLELLTAFRYNETRITYTDADGKRYRKEKPLTSRYRGLVNLSYATRFQKWVFDATAQFNGPTRLPGLQGYGSPTEHSPFFAVYFFQVTKNTHRFDIYAGVENIFDYKQKDPILNPGDPFGTGFDSSRIWGPLMGRKIYAGIRLRIGRF